jgi:hypothetical protein
MQLDPEYLRQHYASLSDDALLRIDRADLVDMARILLDEEVGRRELAPVRDIRPTRGSHLVPEETNLLEEETGVGSEPPRFATAWFTDIRKVALITCVAAVLSLLIPVWHMTQQLVAIGSTRAPWWSVLTLVLAYLLTPILPLFFFALYRNETALRFSKRLRQLSLAAALVFGAIVAIGLVEWIGSLGATSALVGARDPRTISDASVLLSEFSNLACILLLIAFFGQASERTQTEGHVSRLLSFVTKLAVIVGALVVAFALVHLVLTPYSYFQFRNALQIGRRPPPLAAMLAQAIRTLLTQVCLYTAPYVVYYAGLDTSQSPIDGES